ncbi:exodeoxyribonuclease VII large subunit [Prochlorococcus marinus]|uniref:exodeoxyribonuclease VII large subunit n=1 Tax=Prochlorococcus marinus TaxID=1219 RepID=UPI0022B5A29A|nr:exodeoxyribonuclease VII large subunit [Prochlorococcus marinus]
MNIESFPHFSVQDLNQAIGNLLSRGFPPRFLLHATVSKSQLKNGHLWLTLTDGKASISSVIWSSCLKDLDYRPLDQDGVEILGKLNFWENRATLVVQVLQIRPTISTVLRKFEVVRSNLMKDGLLEDSRRRALPSFPRCIAICTSVPSSAYADMIRTAQERWPLAKLLVFPIPVQGEVAKKINAVLGYISGSYVQLKVDVLVLARGGGSREDLMVFDDEPLCRLLANFPIPVITGLGHEDDLTVADLVADHRSATPTAAIVDLLPHREMALNQCTQIRQRLQDYCSWLIQNKKDRIIERRKKLRVDLHPHLLLNKFKSQLVQRGKLLMAVSPYNLLKRGFSIVRNKKGRLIKTINDVKINDELTIQFNDGYTDSVVKSIFTDIK